MAPDVRDERILTAFLIANFEKCLSEFQRRDPFSPEAFRLHKETLKLRSQFGDAATGLLPENSAKLR